MSNDITDLVQSAITGGTRGILGELAVRGIDEARFIQMFVEAGEMVAAVDRVKMSAQILLFHIKKKFVILYVYCNTIDRRGCEGGFRNGEQNNSSNRNEQFHRNSKESLLLY